MKLITYLNIWIGKYLVIIKKPDLSLRLGIQVRKLLADQETRKMAESTIPKDGGSATYKFEAGISTPIKRI